MLEYTLTQAYNMAGVDTTDSDWVRDSKFAAWIDRRKWRLIEYDQDSYRAVVQQAMTDGIEVIIIKGK